MMSCQFHQSGQPGQSNLVNLVNPIWSTWSIQSGQSSPVNLVNLVNPSFLLMFSCNICSISFNNSRTLKSHTRDQHSSSLSIPLSNGQTTTIYRQSNSKFLCFCKKQFETVNGFHRHYRKNNCADMSNIQESIQANSESTREVMSSSEMSLEQIKNVRSLDKISFSCGSSEKIKVLTDSFYDAFDNCFKKMKEGTKWKLRSERVVEDILYSFGSELERENAVHSFIIDTSDSQIKDLFTDDEWAEITNENKKENITLPEEIRSLLTSMNKTTVDEIRKEIFKYADVRYNNYSEDKSFHIDKICHAIESLLHKYQKIPNPLLVEQGESWYNSNIWVPLIDNLYDNIDGINCVRDGPASCSSSKRKRSIQEKFERRKTGSKPDMTIRFVSGGGKPLEFGACEAASYYAGPADKKYYYESTIKLPKMLKDMLFDLCEYVDWDMQKIKQIGVEGCIQSALVIEFITMTHPKGYVCRLTRSKSFEVGCNVNTFPKTLETLAMSLDMKFRVEKCIELITHPTFDINSIEHQPSPTFIESMPTP